QLFGCELPLSPLTPPNPPRAAGAFSCACWLEAFKESAEISVGCSVPPEHRSPLNSAGCSFSRVCFMTPSYCLLFDFSRLFDAAVKQRERRCVERGKSAALCRFPPSLVAVPVGCGVRCSAASFARL